MNVRLTQEDPIGLAGGMNLYGFAGGDPINFSDPLGLWPCCEELKAAATAVKDYATKQVMNIAASTANTVAGNAVGQLVGFPNVVGVNSNNVLQPRDDNGRWLSSSANPGPAGVAAQLQQNTKIQYGVGLAQGLYHSLLAPEGSLDPVSFFPRQGEGIKDGQLVGGLIRLGLQAAGANPDD